MLVQRFFDAQTAARSRSMPGYRPAHQTIGPRILVRKGRKIFPRFTRSPVTAPRASWRYVTRSVCVVYSGKQRQPTISEIPLKTRLRRQPGEGDRSADVHVSACARDIK
jgi:hypothetical protein